MLLLQPISGASDNYSLKCHQGKYPTTPTWAIIIVCAKAVVTEQSGPRSPHNIGTISETRSVFVKGVPKQPIVDHAQHTTATVRLALIEDILLAAVFIPRPLY